ncbi:MAG: trypsin-like peptidase domain-containing protein [Chloroflexota bacterium]
MKSEQLYSTFFVVLGVVLAILLTSCGGLGSANISRAVLTKDESGTQTTSVFAPDDTFYSVVELENGSDETRVKAVWTAVNVGDAAEPNLMLDEVELTSGEGQLVFDLANDNAWPAGSYQVALYLNDELSQTLDFRVQAPIGDTGGSEQVGEETAVTKPTDNVTTTSGAVTNLQDVRSAVVQIVAQGSFVDPEVGLQLNTAGSGSGFIIDPSGIAVTNNHVVTGSALLEVFVPGEDEPRNAKILGVSECSDLAVIDIEGDDFSYLDWYDGNVSVGLDVYAAGFPLGDPEFTLTRGIVAKEQAGGETSWASVDGVIQHDATINPGNSGGPLVDQNGRIVAVNYAGASQTNQYFAIARDHAIPMIDQLQAGSDVNSIGVNGEAVTDGESIYGIWVSSVQSGSPADNAGVQGGDIITTMEGLVLATDGTMSDYCDILRSNNADDVLSIEVLRFASEEVLEGQLNGRELEQTFSFAQTLGDEVAAAPANGNALPASYEYMYVSDDSGTLEVEIPTAWSHIDGSAWADGDDVLGQGLRAAPDLDAFYDTWTMPGMIFGASRTLAQSMNEQVLLEEFDYSDVCVHEGRFNYSDVLYTGLYEVWADCGGTGSLYVVVTAVPQARNFVIVVGVQIVSDADLDALDRILDSFVVLE